MAINTCIARLLNKQNSFWWLGMTWRQLHWKAREQDYWIFSFKALMLDAAWLWWAKSQMVTLGIFKCFYERIGQTGASLINQITILTPLPRPSWRMIFNHLGGWSSTVEHWVGWSDLTDQCDSSPRLLSAWESEEVSILLPTPLIKCWSERGCRHSLGFVQSKSMAF